MAPCGFAQPTPLPSHMVGRTLALSLGDPRAYARCRRNAPWRVCRDVQSPELQQEQIGCERDSYGALDASHLFGDLMVGHDHLLLVVPMVTAGPQHSQAL